MVRRHIVWHALLLVGALALMAGIFLYTTGAGTLVFRSVWRWVAYGVRWVWFFLQRVLIRLTTRLATKPVWRILGLTAIIAYFSQLAKKHVGPRVSACVERGKRVWGNCPWYMKVAVVIVCVITAIFFGLGLWLFPFGMPFYTRIATKIQVMWANSWLQKKTRSVQVKWRCFLRRRRHVLCVRWVRASRYFLIRRERKTLAWTEEKYNTGASWVKETFCTSTTG